MKTLTLEQFHTELSKSLSTRDGALQKAFSIWNERRGDSSSQIIQINEEHIYYATESGDIHRVSYILENSKVQMGEVEELDVLVEDVIQKQENLVNEIIEAIAEGDIQKADRAWSERAKLDMLIEGVKKVIRGGKVARLSTMDLSKKKKGFVVTDGGRRKQTAVEKAVKKMLGKKLSRSSTAKRARKKSMKLRSKLIKSEMMEEAKIKNVRDIATQFVVSLEMSSDEAKKLDKAKPADLLLYKISKSVQTNKGYDLVVLAKDQSSAKKAVLEMTKELLDVTLEEAKVLDVKEEITFHKQSVSTKKRQRISLNKLGKQKAAKTGFKRLRTKSGSVKLVKMTSKERMSRKKIGAKLGKAKFHKSHNEIDTNTIDLNHEAKTILSSKIVTPQVIVENLLQAYEDGILHLQMYKEDVVQLLKGGNTDRILEEESVAILTQDEIADEVSDILAASGIFDDKSIDTVVEKIYTESRIRYASELSTQIAAIAKFGKEIKTIEEATNIIENSKYGETMDQFLENFISENVDDVAQLQFTQQVIDEIISAIDDEIENSEEDASDLGEYKAEFEQARDDIQQAIESEEGLDEDRFEEIKDMIDEVLSDEEEDEDEMDDSEEDEDELEEAKKSKKDPKSKKEPKMKKEEEGWIECPECGTMNPEFEDTCIECGCDLKENAGE